MESTPQVLSMALTFFLMIDAFGNIPLFASLLKSFTPKKQRRIILREMLIALGVIILFELLGDVILNFINIKTPTIIIAGGVILFLIALKMIFPPQAEPIIDTIDKEPFIVPLAIPLVAGPAVLAAVMLYAGQAEGHFSVISAIFIAWVPSTLILLGASHLTKLIGKRGISALERLMGLVLILIAIQMFLEGIQLFLQKTV